ncbi:ArsR/SmtB family transcription factor [Haloglomus halophilum]|uniref:ArsR/SmtB family transcription factor n=1 Tax=Haloglomus halophilum TaxID=2962672 RepID=UPI0020C93F19|nr:helix-turn-helix domain-containing protein [Haloglomus halophilum]
MSELLSSDSDAASGDIASESAAREGEGDLQTLWLDSEEAGDLLSSLASDTARSVLTALHDEPATASEVADRVDTSLQNARHHLNSLQDADLVEVAETRYSSKGREMNVYAPARDPTVVFVGSREHDGGLLESLRSLLPAVAVLAVASLLVQWLVVPSIGTAASGDLPRIGESLGGGGPLALPVGLVFLAGGLLALGLALAVSRWQATT